MVQNIEWMGHNIVIKNSSLRAELSVDGKTQDFYDGLFFPKEGVELNAITDGGEKVVVRFKNGFFVIHYKVFFDGRQIWKH